MKVRFKLEQKIGWIQNVFSGKRNHSLTPLEISAKLKTAGIGEGHLGEWPKRGPS